MLTSAGSLTVVRDAQNGLQNATTLGNVTSCYVYNNFGEVTNFNAKYNTTDLYNTTYTIDSIGRITSLTETIEGVTNTFSYQYNTIGYLVGVKKNGVTTATYNYDLNGNRISLTDTAGTIIDYVIDGQNRRVGKKVNGVITKKWIYQDQLNPVAELDSANNLVARYVHGTRANPPKRTGGQVVRDYMIKNGSTYRIIADHLGSVSLVVNIADGSIAQRLDYNEYGVELSNYYSDMIRILFSTYCIFAQNM